MTRRAYAVGLVAFALAAAGCGTTAGEDLGDEVSAGPRPSVVDRLPDLPGAVRLDDGLAGTGLARAAPTPAPVYSALVDENGLRRAGPAIPPAGPQVPQPAGPAVPGDAPSAPANVYANTMGAVSPALADIPVRVYVPNSDAHTLSVIDPATMQVIATYATGFVPHHVTASWDMTKLYVNNTSGNSLQVIDPRTTKVVEKLDIIDPYNLYFTPDGSKAIVVAERLQRLDYRDPQTWKLIKSVPIPGSGVDHMDFSADGRYLIASCEFSGHVVKVDNETMEVAGVMNVGGLPIDVKVSPDGSVFYVANQGSHGVHIIDPETMTELDFLPTGSGAHGLNYSRDTTRLFVSNRLGGSVSVIDVASRTVTETWRVGGSPDMLQVSTDGTQLWYSNRFHGSVSVVDTTTGQVLKVIPTGAGAHGVAFFPQPGRYNVGHNGVYR
ncbi:MAG: cytochrome D1 domain-containing protein [Acidimicrobiia bacterium]